MRPALPLWTIALLAPLAVAQPDPPAGPLHTSQTIPDIQTSVNMVPVTVSITDQEGRPIPDIQADEVTVLDNGHPGEIQDFWRDVDTPLTIALVVDLTNSQRDFLDRHYRELLQFLANVMESRDRAFLVTIWGDVSLVTDLTGSLQDLRLGVAELRANGSTGDLFGKDHRGARLGFLATPGRCGGSPIWNGVYSAARFRLQDLPGRKAIVLLTDGYDTGSPRSLDETIEAAQSADAPVYAVFSGVEKTPLPPVLQATRRSPFPPHPREVGLPALVRLAVETGGGAYRATDENAAATFQTIEEELRNLYVLGFVVPDEDRDGKFHKLEVKSSRAGVRIHARKGYTSLR